MIKVPFKIEEFAREMKPKISGMNLSLEYENIESSLVKTTVELITLLPPALYDRLVENYQSGSPAEPDAPAIDCLQRAILHFTLYEHLIFIITHVSNDGVTVKKTDNETTAYKYQTDELNNKLISTAWFWMNQLIQYLNNRSDDFPEWANSPQKTEWDSLPIGLSDFNKWVGVSSTGGEYFLLSAGWIIREVWLDCVCSRVKEPVKSDAIARAVCYEVMGRACQRLAYSCLPEPIRKDVDNEMGKNHRAQADKDIREHIAGKFLGKAESYWNALDLELKKAAIAEQKKTVQSPPVLGEKLIDESDNFYFT
jgi:hypothetical protein